MIFSTGAQHWKTPPARDLQALQNRLREERWTGLAEASSKNGKKITFLICGGEAIYAYPRAANMNAENSVNAWESLADSQAASFACRELSVPALRLCRIVLEHPAPAETLRVAPGRLEGLLDGWLSLAQPNLIALQWTEGEALIMLWTESPRPVHFAASSSVNEDDFEAFQKIFASKECELSRHTFVSDGGAWEEYCFQRMFVSLLEAILARYKELTGLALLNALDRNINRVALEQKLDFSIALGLAADNMLFPNLDRLLPVCKMILEVACEHVGVVLGQNLLRSLVHSAISSLDPHSQRLIEKFSIDAFLGAPRTVLAGEEVSYG